MVAGTGIIHSELSTHDATILRGVPRWFALPGRARYQAAIGAEGTLAEAPIPPEARYRGGLAADAEQFGPFA